MKDPLDEIFVEKHDFVEANVKKENKTQIQKDLTYIRTKIKQIENHLTAFHEYARKDRADLDKLIKQQEESSHKEKAQ